MSSCQNQIPFSVSGCASAVLYISSCIESIGITFNDFIQYIISGPRSNFGTSKPFYSDHPKILAKINSCVCGIDAKIHIQYLLCYDSMCVKELELNIISGGGLFWSGFCLSEA
jgi:hypothetical protein